MIGAKRRNGSSHSWYCRGRLSHALTSDRLYETFIIMRHSEGTRMSEYPKAKAGSQPEYLYEAYRSTIRRAPSQPLIQLPHTLSELTGPVYGHNPIGANRQRSHQPLRRAAAGRAHHRGRAGAGRRWPGRSECAGRDLADERGGALPAHARRSSGAARSELPGGRARPLRTRPGTTGSSRSSRARIPGAIMHNAWRPAHIHFSLVRTRVRDAAGDSDVLSRAIR